MARTSPASSFSSSSSIVQPSGFPPSSAAIRKKKNIGALLSSYYNLEYENKSAEPDIPFSAAVASSPAFLKEEKSAANGATSSSAVQLQQQSRITSSSVSGSHRPAGGAASQPALDGFAQGGHNPFSATNDTFSVVSSGSVEKRKEASYPTFLGGPQDAIRRGGSPIGAADREGRSNDRSSVQEASSTHMMRRDREAGPGDEPAAGCTKGARKGFVAAAEGALAAATGGLGIFLGDKEENEGGSCNHNRDSTQWNQKNEAIMNSGSVEERSRTDLDSEHFDVRAYFSAAVENMSLRELLQASSKLDEEVKQCEGELQMLVYENYTKFLEAAETVRGVKQGMHALKGDMTQLAVRAAAIEDSSKELDDLVRDRAASIEELVSFRQLLDKLQILFTLPDVLRWYLSNEDLESVVSLYLHIHPFLQQQETAYPMLQRLRLLHTEATTLFKVARERLKQQLFIPQDCWSHSSPRTSRGVSSNDRSTSSSRVNALLADRILAADRVKQEGQFVSAATASRVFGLLLRAGESPRELLELYMRNRIHKLELELRQVFDTYRLLLAVQPTLQKNPIGQNPHPEAQRQLEHQQQSGQQQQQQQPPEQQKQQQDCRGVCFGDDIGTSQSSHMPGEGATAGPSRDFSAGPAATTAECTYAPASDFSAVAEQMLQDACTGLSERFMEPFLAALQDILRLRTASYSSPAGGAQTSEPGCAPAAAGLSSAATQIERREGNAASRYGSECATSVNVDVKTALSTPTMNAETVAPENLSTDELEEKICTFLVRLVLRVLKGFLRLIARLQPPAAAVIKTVRNLRALLQQPLHRLALPKPLQQHISEYFYNFNYQVLSVCVADAFRSAYFEAAEELSDIQQFCFSCPAPTADAAAEEAGSATETAAGAAPADRSHASLKRVGRMCFFLNEEQQEAAQRLLSQKEHALLLRGCLAVTDVHRLVEGVCGVSSPLAEKLVLNELGTWTEGYFSVFVAALLRLVRDTPAALLSSPRLRAEAEALRRKEIARCSSRSDTNSRGEGRRASQYLINDRKNTQTDLFRKALDSKDEEDEEENAEGLSMRCCSCCYCWHFDAAATADFSGNNSVEPQRDGQIHDTANIASLEKAITSRCISVEEEVQRTVAAAVIQHLATLSTGNEISSTREDDTPSREGLNAKELKRYPKQLGEHPTVDNTGQQTPSRRLSEDASEADIPRTHASARESHAAVLKRDVLAKRSWSSGIAKEETSKATCSGTDLIYIGRTAVCCVLLMRLGRSLELHGVSKIIAVAAELFPSFPSNFFSSTTAGSGLVGLQTPAADDSGASTAVAPPPYDAHKTARAADAVSVAAGAASGAAREPLLLKRHPYSTIAKEPPIMRLRRVLHAALVTYVYLRGCQGASLGTAALRQMLVPKLSSDSRTTLASAAGVAPCTARHHTADDSTPRVVLSDSATSAFQAIDFTAPATYEAEGKYNRASEWLRAKDREAHKRSDALSDQRKEEIRETAAPANNTLQEEQLDLLADAAGTRSHTEALDASTNASSAERHNSNPTSTAESSVFLSAKEDGSCGVQYCTSNTTAQSGGGADAYGVAVPVSLRGEAATDSSGENAAGSAGRNAGAVDGDGVQSRPAKVKGLMDTLLLLLYHCDEETFVFLGEQRLAGSGMLLLRKGSGAGGISAALLAGSARLPRRLQAAGAGDAAAATVEQRQQQHVRRLARLFGRRRTAIEKEMERLFARKQPVFSRVSLNRHKALMAIFKVACRPLLEAVRNSRFTRLDVRQMQVECAAAAESVRDLVASEDGCVVDGLLDELVASSLRRCVQISRVDELTGEAYCVAASGPDSRTPAGLRRGPVDVSADVCRSNTAAAVPQWSGSALDGNLGAAHTLTAEGTAVGRGEKGGNGVLLEPAIVEDICNRSGDRSYLLLSSSKCI